MPTTPPIVPQQSIRGVSVGMTPAAVVSRLGRPAHVQRGTSDLGPYTEFRYRGLRVTFAAGGGVSQLETTSVRDRTARSVGVGSTEAFTRSHLQGLRCATESGVRHCHLGLYRAGRIVTDLFFRRGEVWRVVVGRVLD